MKSKIGKEFDEVCRWVRAEFPVERGYRIETVAHLTGSDGILLDGELRYTPGGTAPYRILVCRDMPIHICVETLLHEVAHVLHVEKRPRATDRTNQHNREWGEEFARVYRKYHQWLEKETS
jgi:hypothetical protein